MPGIKPEIANIRANINDVRLNLEKHLLPHDDISTYANHHQVDYNFSESLGRHIYRMREMIVVLRSLDNALSCLAELTVLDMCRSQVLRVNQMWKMMLDKANVQDYHGTIYFKEPKAQKKLDDIGRQLTKINGICAKWEEESQKPHIQAAIKVQRWWREINTLRVWQKGSLLGSKPLQGVKAMSTHLALLPDEVMLRDLIVSLRATIHHSSINLDKIDSYMMSVRAIFPVSVCTHTPSQDQNFVFFSLHFGPGRSEVVDFLRGQDSLQMVSIDLDKLTKMQGMPSFYLRGHAWRSRSSIKSKKPYYLRLPGITRIKFETFYRTIIDDGMGVWRKETHISVGRKTHVMTSDFSHHLFIEGDVRHSAALVFIEILRGIRQADLGVGEQVVDYFRKNHDDLTDFLNVVFDPHDFEVHANMVAPLAEMLAFGVASVSWVDKALGHHNCNAALQSLDSCESDVLASNVDALRKTDVGQEGDFLLGLSLDIFFIYCVLRDLLASSKLTPSQFGDLVDAANQVCSHEDCDGICSMPGRVDLTHCQYLSDRVKRSVHAVLDTHGDMAKLFVLMCMGGYQAFADEEHENDVLNRVERKIDDALEVVMRLGAYGLVGLLQEPGDHNKSDSWSLENIYKKSTYGACRLLSSGYYVRQKSSVLRCIFIGNHLLGFAYTMFESIYSAQSDYKGRWDFMIEQVLRERGNLTILWSFIIHVLHEFHYDSETPSRVNVIADMPDKYLQQFVLYLIQHDPFVGFTLRMMKGNATIMRLLPSEAKKTICDDAYWEHRQGCILPENNVVVVIRCNDEFFMGSRSAQHDPSRELAFPGGGVDTIAPSVHDFSAAAQREVCEEVGLFCEIDRLKYVATCCYIVPDGGSAEQRADHRDVTTFVYELVVTPEEKASLKGLDDFTDPVWVNVGKQLVIKPESGMPWYCPPGMTHQRPIRQSNWMMIECMLQGQEIDSSMVRDSMMWERHPSPKYYETHKLLINTVNDAVHSCLEKKFALVLAMKESEMKDGFCEFYNLLQRVKSCGAAVLIEQLWPDVKADMCSQGLSPSDGKLDWQHAACVRVVGLGGFFSRLQRAREGLGKKLSQVEEVVAEQSNPRTTVVTSVCHAGIFSTPTVTVVGNQQSLAPGVHQCGRVSVQYCPEGNQVVVTTVVSP